MTSEIRPVSRKRNQVGSRRHRVIGAALWLFRLMLLLSPRPILLGLR